MLPMSPSPRPGSAAPSSERVRVVRNPRRGHYDAATIHAILDQGMVAHLGFPDGDGGTVVIPVAYARAGNELVLHAAVRGRLQACLLAAPRVSAAVTHVDGLVLARSAFHHSVNYRSVVILGQAREVRDDAEKRRLLDALVEHLVPGRVAEVRPMTDKEVALTAVLTLPLDEASAKIRDGGPVDDPKDLDLPTWAGVIPLQLVAGEPVAADDVAPSMAPPPSVAGYRGPVVGDPS